MTSSLQGVEIGLRNEELRAELGKRLQKSLVDNYLITRAWKRLFAIKSYLTPFFNMDIGYNLIKIEQVKQAYINFHKK